MTRYSRTFCAVLALTAGLGTLTARAQTQSARDDVGFPALERSYLKVGDFIGPDHVRRIMPGLSKDQVRLELGNPHFNEGLFAVSEWDYAFNFYTGQGNEYVTCQFKVKFDRVDGLYRVASTHWKGSECESYLTPKPAVVAAPAAAVPVAAPAAPRRVSLGADGLFVFGKSGYGDLLPQGRQRLESLAADMQPGKVTVSSVLVTGHTDRIGSTSANMALSQARAGTVRDYLVRKGVDAGLVRAVGMGEANPVAACPGGDRATPSLVACLQPNRRVDIEVVALQP